MKHKVFNIAELEITDREIYLAMGYRDQIPDDNIRNLVIQILNEVQSFCNPQGVFRIETVLMTGTSHIESGGHVFHIGKIIGSYLSGISHACWFLATAGKEYDNYLHHLRSSDDIVKEFVADAIGSVIAETCVSEISKELNLLEDWNQTLPYSPGYCGWNIMEQEKLFPLFPSHSCGIFLNDSCLMSPVKSISGFFGLGKEIVPQSYRCNVCSNKNCFKRKEKNYD